MSKREQPPQLEDQPKPDSEAPDGRSCASCIYMNFMRPPGSVHRIMVCRRYPPNITVSVTSELMPPSIQYPQGGMMKKVENYTSAPHVNAGMWCYEWIPDPKADGVN
jgi:hypothetical protein